MSSDHSVNTAPGSNPRENKRKEQRGYRPRRRKRKLISTLLTALFPGLGHLYLRMFSKAVTLIYLILIDLSALIYFSSVRIQINVPLIALMVLFIPIVYFYSIYDVLQATDTINSRTKRGEDLVRQRVWRGLGIGSMLIIGGVIVAVLYQKPKWLQTAIEQEGSYISGSVLIAMSLFLFIREVRRKMVRTGRFTAILLIATVGLLLILEQSFHTDYVLLLLTWWPLIFVALGIEYVAVLLLKRRKQVGTARRLRLDSKGMLLSVAAAAAVFIVTQQDHYWHLWNKVSLDLTAATMEFSEQKGYSFPKETLYVPVSSDNETLAVDGLNGNITVVRGQVFDMQIQAKVYVDELDQGAALKVARGTKVEVADGNEITISVNDESYGPSSKRHPKVNLYITVPFNRDLKFDLSTANGDMLVRNISSEHIAMKTGNGAIELRDVYAEVSAKTLNGNITLSNITGDVDADTKGGKVISNHIQGAAKLSTMVGDLELTDMDGDIDASTKNGNITISEAKKQLDAESLNGLITVRSSVIGGDWSVYSAVGEVNITLPSFGSYHLVGSCGYGEIISNLPFPVENKTIEGEFGDGEYEIKLESNSDLIVNREEISF